MCSQLSQCHTYSAVSKLISAQGGDLTSLRERFAILCALGEKVTKQGSSSSTANNKWYRNFLACSGAVEALVLWLKDFCKHYYFVIDEKLAMVTQYMNGINANASGVVDSLQICGLTNKYIEVLVFILEEVSTMCFLSLYRSSTNVYLLLCHNCWVLSTRTGSLVGQHSFKHEGGQVSERALQKPHQVQHDLHRAAEAASHAASDHL